MYKLRSKLNNTRRANSSKKSMNLLLRQTVSSSPMLRGNLKDITKFKQRLKRIKALKNKSLKLIFA